MKKYKGLRLSNTALKGNVHHYCSYVNAVFMCVSNMT